jgi:hypothetical protein
VQFLSRRELGLAPGRDELTARQEQVVLFVATERQRQQQEHRARPELTSPERRQFHEEADPEEDDMSDAELMQLAHRRGRR